jgi:hypothetical protein
MDSRTIPYDVSALDPTRLCPECKVPLHAVNITVRSYDERTIWICLTCQYCTCED